MSKQTVTLNDAYEGASGPHEVTIEITEGAIIITPAGYGDHNSIDGEGSPILFEFCEGIPRVVIWSDINEEESTHAISLQGAQESRREVE